MTTIKINTPGSTPVASSSRPLPSPKSSFLEKISYLLIIAASVLSLLVLAPLPFVSQNSLKVSLVAWLVALAFCLWIVARLKDGVLVTFKHPIFWAFGVLALVYLVSTFASSAFLTSFIGLGNETETFAFVLILIILSMLTAFLFRRPERMFYFYGSIFTVFILVSIFQFIRLAEIVFNFSLIKLSFLSTITVNTIGSWFDFGVFFGLVAVVLLSTIEMFKLKHFAKILVALAILVALFFLALVDFALVWWCIGIFALMLLVYSISFGGGALSFRSSEATPLGAEVATVKTPKISLPRRIPIIPLLVMVITLVFIIGGKPIAGALADRFSIKSLDVRPTMMATLSLAKSSAGASQFFGVGPNRFFSAWVLNKPAEVNQTAFWNSDFNSGYGLIPTAMVTVGAIGTLAWLFFLLVFVYLGYSVLSLPIGNQLNRYLTVSSFFGSLYLLVILIAYTPGVSIVTLAFIFFGLFVASASREGAISIGAVSLVEKPKSSFAYVFVLVLVFIATIALGYLYAERFASSIYFNQGITAFGGGDFDQAESGVAKAVALSRNDLYYRSLADVYLGKMNNLVSGKKVTGEELRTRFQALLGQAEAVALEAVKLDQGNYQNWLYLGRIYETIMPTNIANAYENAKSAYNQALTLNPNSPMVMAFLGRLELGRGNRSEARDFLNKALLAKPDYSDAQSLLNQLR
ncbi:MAG: tetratricopeptide repeat protein [Candidatus Paceibacterota bacterium]